MLADVHTLLALTALWKRIATVPGNWDAVFGSLALPVGLAEKWRRVLCPDGDASKLKFDEALVNGRPPATPAMIVELGSSEEYEKLLGAGQLGPRSDNAIVTMLRENVTITCWHPTKTVTQGMATLAMAMMRYAHSYFQKQGYSGQGLVRTADLSAWEDLSPERHGNFRRRITWRFEREYRFAPLLGDEPIETTIVAHHEDAVDAWGDPGRVSPREED